MTQDSTAPGGSPKPSKAEALKVASGYLKSFVADEIRNGSSHLSEDAAGLLKFHGSYQQDDRDLRKQLSREKKEKAYQFMVRVRMVGGVMTAGQYLACDELARTVGNQTLRITTRQEFQLHGVLKQDLPTTIRTINETLLSTLAACGDVERNVLCCPAPVKDAVRDQLMEDARRWASHAAPRSSAYWEIWLDGEKIESLPPAGPSLVPTAGDDPVEPLLGKTYLPRKFKTAFAFPEDNCTDIHANDLGYLAVVEGGRIVGYNVLVGGGLGTTPSAQKTFPMLAVPLCYVPRDRFLEIGEAVLKVFRDFGNRSDRKRARLKYVIHDWGLPAFRAKVEEYLGRTLDDPKPIEVADVDDHLGWREQGDGKLYLGLPVENGRIKDDGSFRLLCGLRAFFKKYGTPARLTCQQSILLADLDPAWKPEIEDWLEEYGIASVERISTVRRWAMACVALPTCGLAVTESERAMPSFLDELEGELDRIGLGDERLTVRMTGCPNGCARPYNADIGLVGRSAQVGPDGRPGPGKYTIFLGGRTLGDRLNVPFKDYVPYDRLVPELMGVFERFKDDRRPGESFGEFCGRVGNAALGGEVIAEEAAEA
ncbi:Sulfite reductase [ferredoxin] [Aquisphaera giovannonii]|uniref:Sulfite reductase [ferredoxin] n=1 Tax=Aquisphaera giovannonii TaxID=406548 RepID=A0A5B9VYH4_9BACT|nr:NADPH-dependent assimilatory sulfite reductase hemoprotein subunit [Aquisphaera giovannonii]QEH32785.1 Sulfite reductase [ferredoxin] [Aquisphaera giovannonii]